MDPFTECILWEAALGWSICGVILMLDVFHHVETRRWRAFLIALSGPAVWGLAVWWGWRAVRRRILRRLGLTDCGCCGNH